MKNIYFDNAATTQIRKEVVTDMKEVLGEFYGNPSSTHGFGRVVKSKVEQARKTIAKYLNAHPSEIIFTSGGTEADNMILRSAVRDLDVKTIITSKIEHHAVLHTVEELEKQYGITLHYVELLACGTPDIKHLESLLKTSSGKVLVSLMDINNEVGNKLPLNDVANLCKQYNAFFHSDTVQSVGHYKIDIQETPIDFMVAAAHKFHGPKGIGFAFIRRNSGLKPLIFGGSQERGFRAGTESVHNIVGMETALKMAYDNLEKESSYIKDLKAYFIKELSKAVPKVKFNGSSGDLEKSTYTLINVCLPFTPEKALILLFHLDINGIACSRGSACQSGSSKGSHVLSEILSEEELDYPSLRFSFSIYNTNEEIDYTVKVLKDFLES